MKETEKRGSVFSCFLFKLMLVSGELLDHKRLKNEGFAKKKIDHAWSHNFKYVF